MDVGLAGSLIGRRVDSQAGWPSRWFTGRPIGGPTGLRLSDRELSSLAGSARTCSAAPSPSWLA